jgi:hypothetical protein
MQIKFANIFLNKLGAAEASSVIGCLDRLLEMQQQRVNTPPVLFDGAVSLKDLVTTGTSWVGWRMRSTACFSQNRRRRVLQIQRSTLAGRACRPHIPTSFHEPNGSFMLGVDVTTMFGP